MLLQIISRPLAINETIRTHTEVTGSRPLVWYTGRCSINIKELVMEEGGSLYSSHDYADDLPYFFEEGMPGSLKMVSIGLRCRLVGRPRRGFEVSEVC